MFRSRNPNVGDRERTMMNTKKMCCLASQCGLYLFPFLVQAQTVSGSSSEVTNSPPAAPPTRHIAPYERILSGPEVQLTFALLFFGLIIIGLQFLIMHKTNSDSQTILKMSTVTLVIISTLFLITAGFSGDQIAPATGLLGTIVGYVLGRDVNKG